MKGRGAGTEKWTAGCALLVLLVSLAAARSQDPALWVSGKTEWVPQAHALIRHLDGLRPLIIRAIRAQQAYIHDAVADPASYHAAVGAVREALATLEELTGASPHHQRSFAALKSRVEIRLARLQEGIELRDVRGLGFAKKYLGKYASKTDIEDITEVITQMKRTEVAVLRERTRRGSWADEAIPIVAPFGGALAFALIAAIGLLTLRDAAERRRVERARAKLAAIVESSDDAIFEKTLDFTITSWNAGARRLYGYVSEEVIGESFGHIFPPDRSDDLHRLEAHVVNGEGIEHFETVHVRKDGGRIDVSLTMSLIKDAAGKEVTGVSTIVRDVTERKRTERRAAAQHAVTQALADSSSLREAAPNLLRLICESLDWQLGVLWSVDAEGDVLRCVDAWHGPVVGGDFATISRLRTFPRGGGLPGRVWARREPAWVTDVGADPEFPLGRIAAKDGLDAALAFPVLLGSEVLGVLAFFSHRLRKPDEALLAMMTTIGSQIGQFIERKRAEEQTYRTQQYLADFLENATVGLNWVGPDGVILWANHAEMSLLGYSRDEYIGRSIAEFHVDPGVATDILARLARNETLREYEASLRCRDGSVKHVMIDASVLWENGKFVHARSFTRDITERKRAEAEVYRSEHRLAVQYAVTRILAESATLAGAGARILSTVCEGLGWDVGILWRMDRRAQVLRCLEVWQTPAAGGDELAIALRQRTCAVGEGLPGSIWTGKAPVWVPDIASDPAFAADAAAAVRAGLHGAFGFPILLDTEILGVLEFFSREVREPDENSLQTLSTLGSQIAQFIEHKQAEEARAQLAAIVESSEDAIIGSALDGTIVSWNSGAQRIYGYAAPEARGRAIGLLLPDDHAEELPAILRRIRDGEIVEQFESVGMRKDGRRIDVSVTVSPIRDGGGRIVGAAAIARDITRQKQAEVQLRQAQKLESVGRLAAGIAHEINTPIQFIGDNTRFLSDGFAGFRSLVENYRRLLETGATGADGADAAVLAREITRIEEEADIEYLKNEIPRAISQTLDGVDRVATIVRAMKDFAHGDTTHEKAPADLKQALLSTLTVARNELKYVADVETELGDLPPVTCHVNELNQVFLNLLVNAAHAIADAAAGSDRRGCIRVRTACEGNTALIAISDTGGGIPEEIRTRIFDPFFTTKEVGRGTGQGLAIARSVVVDKHGGTLTFESEAGRGTTFFVRIPIEPDAVACVEAAA